MNKILVIKKAFYKDFVSTVEYLNVKIKTI